MCLQEQHHLRVSLPPSFSYAFSPQRNLLTDHNAFIGGGLQTLESINNHNNNEHEKTLPKHNSLLKYTKVGNWFKPSIIVNILPPLGV